MHGAEYDELSEAVEKYKDKFESVKIAEPLLGEVGSDATVVNEDKKAVAEILTKEAVEKAGYDSLDAARKRAQHLYLWDMEQAIQQRFHTARCRAR